MLTHIGPALILALLVFSIGEVSPQRDCEVKFRGVVTTDEQGGQFPICYGSYFCDVEIQDILYDPNGALSLNERVTVCYTDSLSLKKGDCVECYGVNCQNSSCYHSCAKQYTGKVACCRDPYYVIPEFPSLILLPLFMLYTLLATVLYLRKIKA